MADKKRVNLTVNPETKAEWDSAVEDSTEYSSLSDLIRQSVARELSDSPNAAHAPQSRDTAQTEAQAEVLEQVTGSLASMENTLSDLDDRLTNVEKEVTATAQADLKNQVFDALPEHRTGDQLAPDEHEEGKSSQDIAEEIGEDRERVYETIQKLEEQTGVIREVMNIEGQQFWAREAKQ